MSLFSQFGRTGPLNVVLVQTKTGGSIKGVLIHRDRTGLILRAASILSPGPNGQEIWSKAIGDVVIPVENTDFFQQALPVTVLD